MKRALLAGLAMVLVLPSAARALATESFGNAPIGAGGGFDGKLLDLVNMHARVYWFEVNGNPFFYFKGGTKELNEALRAFAALPDEKKEIILLAGPGERKSLGGKPVAYDWSVHVPMGRHFRADSDASDDRATFTIHIPNPLPPAPADPTRVRKWIADLNSDDFKTRAKAAVELEALGPGVAPTIREALKGKLTAEARDRLDRLLAHASGRLTLDALQLPEKVPVLGVEGLHERARKALSDKDPMARGVAASSLNGWGLPAKEIVPDLEKVLKNEGHEYPIRCAAGTASHLGIAGKPLLPALRERLESTDKNVVYYCQYAIDAVEKATEVPVDDAEVKKKAQIRKEIREFVTRREGK